MGALCKLIDAILFIFFLFISIVAPLIDGQTILPHHLFPSLLLELKSWYAQEYNDYLVLEKPHFFVGLVWLELVYQVPLAIASAYGIASGKSWVNVTCMLYGASALTSMAAILSELTLSNKASDKLLMMYYPFLGLALLALFRGLLTQSGKSVTIGRRPVLNRKKRA